MDDGRAQPLGAALAGGGAPAGGAPLRVRGTVEEIPGRAKSWPTTARADPPRPGRCNPDLRPRTARPVAGLGPLMNLEAIATAEIAAFYTESEWYDVGTISSFEKLNAELGRHPLNYVV